MESFVLALNNSFSPRFKNLARYIAYTPLILICVGCLGAGAYLFYSSWQLVNSSIRTTGAIVELEKRFGTDQPFFSPVFTFTDGNGTEHKVTSSNGQYPPDFEIGEQVQVLYDPALPENARINSFDELWLRAIALIFAGACCSISLFPMRYMRNKSFGKEHFLFGFSAIFLIAGIGAFIHTWIFVLNAKPVEGKVIGFEAFHDEDSIAYAPIFTFYDDLGVEHKAYSNNRTYPRSYEEGEIVQVLYDPDKPINAMINNIWELWAVAILFSVGGGCGCLVCLFFIIRNKRRKRQTAGTAPVAEDLSATP